jgi:class 3 adenylate cyclase/DNA-binding winged helix-turn-helix (wHTH) protein
MEFRLLGPLEILEAGHPLAVAGKPRSLLAALLVHANEVVSADRLIDALWGGEPPATAQTALQVHVSQLRKVLGPDRIETQAPGYRLVVAREELDSARFERLLAEDRPEDALALWRGPALAEFAQEEWANAEAARLGELRLAAEEARIERALTHDDVRVADVEALVRREPLRERPRAQLMRALYRSGRQADALAVFQETRKLLVEELGIEPGPELQELYRQILNQDEALAPRGRAEPPTPRPREERKVVTVLFCDLVGFTSRSEQADPEDMSALLSRYHVRLRSELERFGGTVEKFVGDAVMALFGAPVAHEDDAERAVRAGLAIRAWIAEAEKDLEVRIGISTGEALVRLGASPAQGEAMAVGDVVNTAARLQQVAPEGAILVGEATFRATRDRIVYKRADPVEAKGKARLVDAWVAEDVRSGMPDLERPTSPFVGRSAEQVVLAQLFDRVVEQRSAQLVTIVGEPGIGKTRLLTEFRAGIETDGVEVRHGRCLAYGDGITFWALGEIVKAQAGILESDTPDAAAAKLSAAVDVVARQEDRPWLVSQLAPLVGAAHPGTAADQGEAFAAWRTFLEAVAAHAPLVLLVEDIHWADAALLEFLGGLVEWVADAALLVVTTARPELFERAPDWAAGKRNATTLALAPLSDGDTSTVVAALLREGTLPPETHALLLARAGGNPLYAEEFVRLVRDRGQLESADEIPVPEGIRAVIAARIDTLPRERKELVHAAAVVGKVFWAGALASITRMSKESVLASLHELGRKELIKRARDSSMADDVEYLFWHVLVRDVAYGQIPRTERARMHVAAAEWIERVAGERSGDHAEFLAHHYRTASELERASGDRAATVERRAVDWTVRAGDRVRSIDPTRAARFYRAALELLSAGDERRAPILVACADASVKGGTSELEKAEADALEAIELFRRAGAEVEAADALRVLSFIRIYGSVGVEERLAPIQEALEILERHPPTPELARAHERLLLHYANVRDRDAILAAGPRALELLAQFDLMDEAALVESRMLFQRCQRGEQSALAEFERLVERVMDPRAGYGSYTACIVLQNMGGAAQAVGVHNDVICDIMERARAFASSRGLTALARFVAANNLEGLYAKGDWDTVLGHAEEILAAPEAPVRARLLALDNSARVLAARGDPTAKDVAEKALGVGRQIDEFLAVVLTSAALASASAGDFAAARSLGDELAHAIAASRWFREDGMDVARALAVAGRFDVIRSFLESIESDAPLEGPIRGYALALVHESDGDLQRAAASYADAASRWHDLGYVYNHALSLLGAGRCRIAFGRREDDGAAGLHEAREILERLGAVPLVAEVDALLAAVA